MHNRQAPGPLLRLRVDRMPKFRFPANKTDNDRIVTRHRHLASAIATDPEMVYPRRPINIK